MNDPKMEGFVGSEESKESRGASDVYEMLFMFFGESNRGAGEKCLLTVSLHFVALFISIDPPATKNPLPCVRRVL